MAMRVPVYEEQSKIKEQRTQATQISSADPNAFGANAWGAAANLGKDVTQSIQTVGKIVEQRIREDRFQKQLSAKKDYMTEMQGILSSTEEVEENGTKVPKGFLNRQLGQTNDATTQFDTKAKELRDKYAQNFENESERLKFENDFDSMALSARESVLKHQAQQDRLNRINNIQASVEASKNVFVNFSSPDDVIKEIEKTVSSAGEGHALGGLKGDALNLANQQTRSDLTKSAVNNWLDKDWRKSEEILEKSKGLLPADDYQKIKSVVEAKKFDDELRSSWGSLSSLRLSDNTPDLGKIERSIFSREDLTTEKKEKLWDYAKAKANEDRSQYHQKLEASDRSFMNTAIKMKSSGASFDDVKRLAANTGIDDVDRREKMMAAQKLFEKQVTTDPETYISIWEKVKSGNGSKEEINNAMSLGKISVSDWTSLRKDFFNESMIGNSGPEKEMMKRIDILADEKFSNTKDKDKFKYAVMISTQGKTPEEKWTIANDLLQKEGGFFSDKKWYLLLKKNDENNSGWGNIYQKIGRDTVSGIIKNATLDGKKITGVDDVESFAKEMGGYQNLKEGSPIGDAIRILNKGGSPINKENIDYIIKSKGWYNNAITRESADNEFRRFTDTSVITNSGNTGTIAQK